MGGGPQQQQLQEEQQQQQQQGEATPQQVEATTTEAAPQETAAPSSSLIPSIIFESTEVKHTEAATVFGVATLKAPLFEPSERTPIDVVCVIDVSGSMGGSKLENAKKTLDFVIKQLRPSDRMALVTYDSNVKTVFGLTAMDAANKEQCTQACSKLRAGSMTNLSGGMLQGFKVLTQAESRNAVSSVLLMTDGLANEGITSVEGMVKALQAVKTDLPNTTLYTFGYGADHNATLLKGLSEAGGGMYYFIESIDTIPQYFADCLGGLLSTVAQNIEFELATVPGVTFAKIHTVRPFELTQNNTRCKIQLGDLQSEEERDILFELSLPATNEACASDSVISGRASYMNVVEAKMETCECAGLLARPVTVGPQTKSEKVEQQKNRLEAQAALAQAKKQAEEGRFQEAHLVLDQAMIKFKAANDSFSSELADDLLHCQTTVTSAQAYKQAGSQRFTNVMQQHAYQRANLIDETREQKAYVTKAKANFRMASKF
jgi:Mg-chelatase subunit ChlD